MILTKNLVKLCLHGLLNTWKIILQHLISNNIMGAFLNYVMQEGGGGAGGMCVCFCDTICTGVSKTAIKMCARGKNW